MRKQVIDCESNMAEIKGLAVLTAPVQQCHMIHHMEPAFRSPENSVIQSTVANSVQCLQPPTRCTVS